MRVLLIKTSSLGDIIHTLPALTDAGQALPAVTFDWVIEENFAEIACWHPQVDRVIPVAIRRWRKNLFSAQTRKEFYSFCHMLREMQYDFIIDAQGLFKTFWVMWLARGSKRAGFDWHSAREPGVTLFYPQKYAAARDWHAVMRLRMLFSQALHYSLPGSTPHYGIDRTRLAGFLPSQKYIVFLHGTTWTTKHWPESYWCRLAQIANQQGFLVKLFWGHTEEYLRAQRIAAACDQVEVLSSLGLTAIAQVLAGAKAVVAVDTGLGHLAAALDVPTVSLYGATDPLLTGAVGQSQIHLTAKFSCAPCFSRECTYRDADPLLSQTPSPLYPAQPPCFATLPPEEVWAAVAAILF